MVTEDIILLLSILVASFSLLLLIVSTAAYIKTKSIKLLIISIAFSLFFIKGVLLSINYFVQEPIGIILDFIILLMLYYASVKK